jgi:hypothetical protein
MVVSNSVPDMTYSLNTSFKSSSSSSSNVADSSDDDSEDESMIRRSVTFQDLTINRASSPSIKPGLQKKTSTPPPSQKSVMDRMKERHRLESRQIQMQPSFPHQAMPARIPVTPYDQMTYYQKPITQSQSFTMVKSPPLADGNKIRSTISLNDMGAEQV